MKTKTNKQNKTKYSWYAFLESLDTKIKMQFTMVNSNIKNANMLPAYVTTHIYY